MEYAGKNTIAGTAIIDVTKRKTMSSTDPATTASVIVATVQLIAPGLGSSWFGSDFIPESWTYAQRYTYLWTELVPVLIFAVIGVLFWWLGRRTRKQTVDVATEPVTPA